MVLLWYEYVLITAIFAGILSIAGLYLGYRVLPKQKVAIQKTVGSAIGTFMQSLAEQAAEEEGSGSGSPVSGALSLGGFKIDPQLIQLAVEYGPQLLKLAQQFGLMKGGGGGTGGSGL